MVKKLAKLIFGILAISTVSSNIFAEETITILNGEWAPYTSKKLKHYGVSSHIVTEAFALSGIKVEYDFYPWARIGKMVKMGKKGGVTLIYTKTPEREKYAVYSEPILIAHSAFFHLKSYPFDWEIIEDLKGIPIGGTYSYNYGPEFRSAEKNKTIQVDWVSTDLQNLKKLLAGRIKIFPIAVDVGFALLNTEFSREEAQLITYHPKSFATQEFHVLISKKNEDHERLIRLFNKGLKSLKDSGVFDRYYEASRRGEYHRE